MTIHSLQTNSDRIIFQFIISTVSLSQHFEQTLVTLDSLNNYHNELVITAESKKNINYSMVKGK